MKAAEIVAIALSVTIVVIVWTAVIISLARNYRRPFIAPKLKLPLPKATVANPPPDANNVTSEPRTRAQRIAEYYRSLVDTHFLIRSYGRDQWWTREEEAPLLGNVTGTGLAPYRDASPHRNASPVMRPRSDSGSSGGSAEGARPMTPALM